MKKILIIIAMLMASVYSYAQLVEANENFKNGNYSKAKELYLVDYEKGKLDKYSLANLGFCYIAEYDYINAEKIFAEVIAIKRIEPEYHFYYAEILKINKKYSLAKQEFQKSSELFLQNTFILDQRTASCDSLMLWQHNTTEVIIENPTHLNSPGADFCAMRVGDKIIFVSEREINNEEAAWKPSFELDDTWKKQAVSSYYYTSYTNNIETIKILSTNKDFEYNMFSVDDNNNIFYTAQKLKQSWEEENKPYSIYKETLDFNNPEFSNQTPIQIEGINNKESFGHPSVNNTSIFFVAVTNDNYGGSDIYTSNYVNGKWEEATNLGDIINTQGNEMYPYFYNDTLYFASDGHPGYGGLDIYYSIKKENKWITPVNLKAPYNSRGNDFAYNFSDHKKGFFTSNRSSSGLGGNDIYTFRFPEKDTYVEPEKRDTFYVDKYGGNAIFYSTDDAKIHEDNITIINQIADTLNKYPSLKLKISSFTDIRGTEDLNNNLCQNRADNIAKQFYENNVSENKITIDLQAMTDDRTSDFAHYCVQIGFVDNNESAAYFANKYQIPENEISCYQYNKGYSYTISSYETLREASIGAIEFNQNYQIGAFPVIIANNKRLTDTRYAINRRTELILYY